MQRAAMMRSGANDPSVLPVRHTLECPRQATLVVSALQRHAVGAVGNWGSPAAGRRSRLGPRTADGAAAAPGLPLDSSASGSTTSNPLGVAVRWVRPRGIWRYPAGVWWTGSIKTAGRTGLSG